MALLPATERAKRDTPARDEGNPALALYACREHNNLLMSPGEYFACKKQ